MISDTWCKHRTSFDEDHPVCHAGIDYRPFIGDYENMPCLGKTEKARKKCLSYEARTAEEIAAREKKREERFQRVVLIRNHIIATKQRTGIIDCPACKTGRVSFSLASNGHVHARCSTPNCAAWME